LKFGILHTLSIYQRKVNRQSVKNTELLSILTHTSKILTKIILGRIEKKIEANLAEEQFGFGKNTGTREAILCLQNIIQKSFTVNKKVYVAFVDLLKASDNINWNTMMKILKMIKIDYRDRRIIRELYKHQSTFIKTKNSEKLLKASDNINWNTMMKILKMIKIDYRDRRIIRELYKHQSTFIKTKNSEKL